MEQILCPFSNFNKTFFKKQIRNFKETNSDTLEVHNHEIVSNIARLRSPSFELKSIAISESISSI
jgi:hypothetical protein